MRPVSGPHHATLTLREDCVTTRDGDLFNDEILHTVGRVVRMPVNASPGLKVNRNINFSCIKMFFTAYVLCSLRLFKLKTEGRTI